MEIYPLVDDQTVLRVPRRTEQQLIDEFGSSGRKALATGHEVSTVTETELHDLEHMEGYIGAFVPDTTPMADLDLEGNFRYYSLQRRVKVTKDLRSCTTLLDERCSRLSVQRFLRDVRDMFDALGLLPDLAGKGNLVLDRFGLVKLIDINNFRPLISDQQIDDALPDDEKVFEEYILGRRSLEEITPAGFVDDLGHPIGDLTLGHLRTLEVRALGRDHKEVDKDPFYAPLHNERRQQLLSLMRPDIGLG